VSTMECTRDRTDYEVCKKVEASRAWRKAIDKREAERAKKRNMVIE
jgi:hypothetical protein